MSESSKKLKKAMIIEMNHNGSSLEQIAITIANVFKEPILNSKV